MSDGAPDQSMEDILASIKKIITADSDAARRVPPTMPGSIEEEDVLELGPGPGAAPSHPSAGDHDDALLSGATAQASKAALAALSTLTIDPRADGNTLDGLVREMLRPMLKEWLDANLPGLVERIVAREVARVVGR